MDLMYFSGKLYAEKLQKFNIFCIELDIYMYFVINISMYFFIQYCKQLLKQASIFVGFFVLFLLSMLH